MISLVEFFVIALFATLTAAGASHGYQLLRQPRGRRRSAPLPAETPAQSSPGAWHTPRQHSRHRISCQIEYGAGAHRSLGLLVDISKQGWRVRGEQAVVKGAALSLTVTLPGDASPIVIDEAVVRWSNGTEFGLEVTSIAPGAATKLSDYLTEQLPESEPLPLTVSPFSYN